MASTGDQNTQLAKGTNPIQGSPQPETVRMQSPKGATPAAPAKDRPAAPETPVGELEPFSQAVKSPEEVPAADQRLQAYQDPHMQPCIEAEKVRVRIRQNVQVEQLHCQIYSLHPVRLM